MNTLSFLKFCHFLVVWLFKDTKRKYSEKTADIWKRLTATAHETGELVHVAMSVESILQGTEQTNKYTVQEDEGDGERGGSNLNCISTHFMCGHGEMNQSVNMLFKTYPSF